MYLYDVLSAHDRTGEHICIVRVYCIYIYCLLLVHVTRDACIQYYYTHKYRNRTFDEWCV